MDLVVTDGVCKLATRCTAAGRNILQDHVNRWFSKVGKTSEETGTRDALRKLCQCDCA